MKCSMFNFQRSMFMLTNNCSLMHLTECLDPGPYILDLASVIVFTF